MANKDGFINAIAKIKTLPELIAVLCKIANNKNLTGKLKTASEYVDSTDDDESKQLKNLLNELFKKIKSKHYGTLAVNIVNEILKLLNIDSKKENIKFFSTTNNLNYNLTINDSKFSINNKNIVFKNAVAQALIARDVLTEKQVKFENQYTPGNLFQRSKIISREEALLKAKVIKVLRECYAGSKELNNSLTLKDINEKLKKIKIPRKILHDQQNDSILDSIKNDAYFKKIETKISISKIEIIDKKLVIK